MYNRILYTIELYRIEIYCTYSISPTSFGIIYAFYLSDDTKIIIFSC